MRSETSEFLEVLVPILIIGTYFVMLAGERLAPRERFVPIKGWRWLGLGFLAMLFSLQGLIPAMLPVGWIADHAILPGHRLGVAWGAVAGFLSITFVDYWLHRAFHRFHVLWRFVHQLHHSPRRVDIYGSAFTHPFEVVLMVLESVLVFVFVLGLEPAAAAIAGYLGAFCAMFQHWNVRTPSWVGWFIQRPEAHCRHHELGVHAWNYGNLTLWDRLFGTFRHPLPPGSPVGFEGGRSGRIGSMLVGVDVHAADSSRPYVSV